MEEGEEEGDNPSNLDLGTPRLQVMSEIEGRVSRSGGGVFRGKMSREVGGVVPGSGEKTGREGCGLHLFFYV